MAVSEWGDGGRAEAAALGDGGERGWLCWCNWAWRGWM